MATENYNISKSYINTIYGLPPAAYSDIDYKNVILNSTPVVELYPGYPEYRNVSSSSGMKLYKFSKYEGNKVFSNILKNVDIASPVPPLKFAFIYEAPFSENFSNEYGESMFEEIGNFKIPFLQEARYITGQSSTSTALNKLSEIFGGNNESVQNNLNQLRNSESGPVTDRLTAFAQFMASGLTKGAGKAVGIFENMVTGMSRYGGQILKLLEGSNIDFPKIWQGSNYAPSYNITVRLTNPDPTSDASFIKYIINPLAYLMCFCVPVSDSESTFTFPLLCKAKCPGLFNIDSGYVQSLDIIKGGDNGDISFNQRPGTIDVRLSFSEMYNTLINVDKQYVSNYDEDRPTLLKYINNLKGKANAPSWYADSDDVYETETEDSDKSEYIISTGPTTTTSNSTEPRISTDTSSDYDTLTQYTNNTTESDTYEHEPLIEDISANTVKEYESAAYNADKNDLQASVQNELNNSTEATSTGTRGENLIEATAKLANEAINATNTILTTVSNTVEKSIDSARNAVTSVYKDWKTAQAGTNKVDSGGDGN